MTLICLSDKSLALPVDVLVSAWILALYHRWRCAVFFRIPRPMCFCKHSSNIHPVKLAIYQIPPPEGETHSEALFYITVVGEERHREGWHKRNSSYGVDGTFWNKALVRLDWKSHPYLSVFIDFTALIELILCSKYDIVSMSS